MLPPKCFARRLTQCRCSSYCGTAVAAVFVAFTSPRRFKIFSAPCTAVFDNPLRSANVARLNPTLLSPLRNSSVHNTRYTRNAAGE